MLGTLNVSSAASLIKKGRMKEVNTLSMGQSPIAAKETGPKGKVYANRSP